MKNAYIALLISSFSLLTTPQIASAGVDIWTSLGPDGGHVLSLAIDPGNPNTLYAGMQTGGAFKSTDGGSNWIAVNNGLTDTRVESLAIDRNDSNTLYVATAFGLDGVYKSTDGGSNWSVVNNGLENTDVFSLAFAPNDSKTLFAGTFGGGVFKSTDAAGNWSALNNGLTNMNVFSLAIDSGKPNTLFAGTSGGGVFVIDQVLIYSDGFDPGINC